MRVGWLFHPSLSSAWNKIYLLGGVSFKVISLYLSLKYVWALPTLATHLVYPGQLHICHYLGKNLQLTLKEGMKEQLLWHQTQRELHQRFRRVKILLHRYRCQSLVKQTYLRLMIGHIKSSELSRILFKDEKPTERWRQRLQMVWSRCYYRNTDLKG